MNRLIDNTYLHAVGRCLNGQSNGISDVLNFLRFLAEIIGADRLFFSATRGGPVYRLSERLAIKINASVEEQLLQHLPRESLGLEAAVGPTAKDLAEELVLFDPSRLPEKIMLEPQFSDGFSPDLGLHDWLSGEATPDDVMRQQGMHHSKLILEILSDSTVQARLARLGSAKDGWTRWQTLCLTSTARLLIYTHIAQQLDAQYLPGADRIRLHSLPVNMSQINTEIASLVQEETLPSEDQVGLSEIVAAIMRVSAGSPRKMLEEAASLRRRLGVNRKYFQQHLPGDILFATASRNRKVLTELVQARLGKYQEPSFARTLKPTLVFPGIPSVSLDVEKLGEWITYKLNRRKVIAVAEILLRSETYDPSDSIRRFLALAGIVNQKAE